MANYTALREFSVHPTGETYHRGDSVPVDDLPNGHILKDYGYVVEAVESVQPVSVQSGDPEQVKKFTKALQASEPEQAPKKTRRRSSTKKSTKE